MNGSRLLLAAALLGSGAAAWAQTVSLQGVLGSSALLIVDGAPPRGVATGATHQGVKVISAAGDTAVVEFGGRRHTLRVGEAPANVGASGAAARGNRIVLTAGSGGHFTTQGTINGGAVLFMVDTGATLVAMGAADAQRLGVDYRNGAVGYASTANGVATMWRIKLSSVRVGDVELHDVDAAVQSLPMPYVLLGNSFLNRFQMKRDNEQMVLERRY